MPWPVHPTGFFGAQGDNDTYKIERSLRFNSADSTYLSWTPAASGNRKTWTWSGWIKRSSLIAVNNGHAIFSASGSGTNYTDIRFEDDQIRFDIEASGQTRVMVTTSPYYRDLSAWYHLVAAFDSTQATASNRVRIYINGVQQTTTNTINQNIDSAVNQAVAHNIGRRVAGSDHLLNAYLTEVHLVDGQVLTPSSFGETDAITGRWKAKAYSGTYGTNGFYLKFADNSGTTATTLGKDSSPNGNNWTPNNFSVTAGAGNDSLVDSPTNYGTDTGVGGEVRGNYCTLNPIDRNTTATLSNGNLDFATATSGHNAIGTIGVSSGKWYWEAQTSAGTTEARATVFGTAASSYYSFAANNTAYGFRFDAGAGTLEYTTNGSTWTSLATGLTSGPYFPFFNNNGTTSKTISVNFGQRPFAYTAIGFKALCTTNLPTPTIRKPSSAMDVVTYTGNGSARSITGLGFSPDLVWVKCRDTAYDSILVDSKRGAGFWMSSNTTADEGSNIQTISLFNSDGFNVGNNVGVNENTKTYVAWAWDHAAIDGLDIVSYTGNGANRTIAHNLGVAPKMIIVKARTTAGTDQGWPVYHASLANTQYLMLNTTAAAATGADYWNSTSPTSSVFSVGTNAAVNLNNDTYIAYLFAGVEGFSRFGSYTGNLSSDGPFVWCGFRPRYIMVKGDFVSNWNVFDAVRGNVNPNQTILRSNLANVEIDGVTATAGVIDFLSNGFKMRGSYGDTNANSTTFIFAAFAESPFKYSRAR